MDKEGGVKATSQFLQPKVQFLGHIVSTEGIIPDPSKTQQVKEWPVPTFVKAFSMAG